MTEAREDLAHTRDTVSFVLEGAFAGLPSQGGFVDVRPVCRAFLSCGRVGRKAT